MWAIHLLNVRLTFQDCHTLPMGQEPKFKVVCPDPPHSHQLGSGKGED